MEAPKVDTTPLRVIRARQKGDMKKFPNSTTIVKRVIYKEEIGVSDTGLPVVVGCFHNPEPPNNVWFVCCIAIGMELWAMKSFAQAKTSRNVKAVLHGWEREVGYQLKLIQESGEFCYFRVKDMARLEQVIRLHWPCNVPQDEKVEIPAEQQAAKKNAERVQKQEEKRLAKLEKAKIVSPPPDTQVKLDFD